MDIPCHDPGVPCPVFLGSTHGFLGSIFTLGFKKGVLLFSAFLLPVIYSFSLLLASVMRVLEDKPFPLWVPTLGSAPLPLEWPSSPAPPAPCVPAAKRCLRCSGSCLPHHGRCCLEAGDMPASQPGAAWWLSPGSQRSQRGERGSSPNTVQML